MGDADQVPPPLIAAGVVEGDEDEEEEGDPPPPLDPNLQALVNALGHLPNPGGKRKVTEFQSGTGPDWLAWKESFRQTVLINQWGDLRARRELKAAMTGMAGKVTRDIIPEQADTLQILAQRMEERFLPEGAGIAARTEFDQMTQLASESLLEWHSRVRDTFMRAFPAVNIQNDYRARDKFALGIRDRNLQWEVYREDAQTFTDVLQRATRISARLAKVGEIHKSAAPPASNNFGINSVVPVTVAAATGIPNSSGAWRGPGGPSSTGTSSKGGAVDKSQKECWICRKKGHFKTECRVWLRRRAEAEKREKESKKISSMEPQEGGAENEEQGN